MASFSKFIRPESGRRGQISDRDLDIFDAVLRYRFCSAAQIVRLVGGNEDVSHRRLRRLWECGLVNRWAFPGFRTHSEFYYYLDNRAPLDLLADRRHLGRILDNYLQNAFKYGEPPVRIDATQVGDMVEVRVLDHGTGVPAEFVSRLFSKFARANTASTKAQQGTGLGLSIVRGLAEANGGHVRYEPNVPHGSCFFVQLPAGNKPAV